MDNTTSTGHEFLDFLRDAGICHLRNVGEGASEREILLACLHLALHNHEQIIQLRKQVDIMNDQDTQLLAIDKSLVTDFATLGSNVSAALAKLQGSSSASDPVVANVITDLGTLDAGVQAINTQLAAALPVAAPAPAGDGSAAPAAS